MPDLPMLTRELVLSPGFQRRTDIAVPPPALLELPEKAVQFGTGAFLRGFVDYFLDEANRQGRFQGRVVMVGSTGSGRDGRLSDQDGLYTLSVQGLVDGAPRREQRVIASVSRALSARDQWNEVLACARNPDLELVFSNTTEVGIALDEGDEAELAPPRSFPGKLTRFLMERAAAFDYDPARGVVVLPCELIEDNGDRLCEIVLALAARWGADPRFAGWLRDAVPFCNTLVDRIVPGAPGPEQAEQLRGALGYRDEMVTTCEAYRLFAIEGDAALRERLGFADADPGVVVTDDVARYRQLKVRILNGTHTAMVSAALLSGAQTVLGAMEDETIGAFVRELMLEEIVPSTGLAEAGEFGWAVLERFSNPFIRHQLFDITLQGTMKMRVRVIPSILAYAERTGQAPSALAFSFAAFLLFQRGDLQDQRRAAGLGVPADEQCARIRALWNALPRDDRDSLTRLVRTACADAELWGADLTRVPGFVDQVSGHLVRAHRENVRAALVAHLRSRRLAGV